MSIGVSSIFLSLEMIIIQSVAQAYSKKGNLFGYNQSVTGVFSTLSERECFELF